MSYETAENSPLSNLPFPNVSNSLKFGWEAIKNNAWFIVIIGGIVAATNTMSAPGSGAGFGTILLFAILIFVNQWFFIAIIRRWLDYWDERRGLEPRRDFSEGVSSAIRGATPRVLPSILWTIALTLIFSVWAAVVAWMFGKGSTLWTILGIIVGVGALAAVVYWSLAMVVVTDRPGNPLAISYDIVRGHAGEVIGTMLSVLLILFAFALLWAGLYYVLGSSTLARIIDAIAMIPAYVIGMGLLNAATVNMYRSVYPTSPS